MAHKTITVDHIVVNDLAGDISQTVPHAAFLWDSGVIPVDFVIRNTALTHSWQSHVYLPTICPSKCRCIQSIWEEQNEDCREQWWACQANRHGYVS